MWVLKTLGQRVKKVCKNNYKTLIRFDKKNYLLGQFPSPKNPDYFKTNERQATHPHQIHLELLSELGLIGYISFLILMFFSIMVSAKNYSKEKNPYQLCTLVYILSCLIPLIPSGSLFSTFFGGIFWFNFGLMISFNRNLKLKV